MESEYLIGQQVRWGTDEGEIETPILTNLLMLVDLFYFQAHTGCE